MNFFQHQSQARSQTKRLFIYFVVAVLAIVLLIDVAIYFAACASNIACSSFDTFWRQPWVWLISLATLAIIGLTSLIRWAQFSRNSGLKAVTMAGARAIDLHTQDQNERVLIHVVEEMSIASGMPMPHLYVMDNETAINAFVAGTEPGNTYLAVTRGCLEQLNRQELQGVIAHEYSHIFNGDMRINIRLIGILAGILVIGQLGEFLARSSRISDRKKDGAQLAIIGLAIMLVGYIGLFFGRLIKAAISRQREFLADASAVQYTRDKDGIAGALFKINTNQKGSLLDNKSAEELSHLCFGASHKIALFNNLLATHPPLPERIKRVSPGFSIRKTVEPNQSVKTSDRVAQNNDSKSVPAHSTGFDNTDSKLSEAEMFISASLISAQVGNVNKSHINRAHRLLDALPESAKKIARNQNDQIASEHLIYALLIANNTLVREDIIKKSQHCLSENEWGSVMSALAEIAPLDYTEQFLLLDLALPRIRDRKDGSTIQTVCKHLIECDRQVSLSEYVMFALVLRSTQSEDSKKRTIIHRYGAVLPEIRLILTSVVQQNSIGLEQKNTLFVQLMQAFGDQSACYQTQPFNPNQFHQALNKLSQLNPMLKKPFIDSLATAIASDGKTSKEEFMIVRAVCEYLDCPIPILA